MSLEPNKVILPDNISVIVLGPPGSGTRWMTFIIQRLLDMSGRDEAAFHTHIIFKELIDKNIKMVFIYRHYLESVLSHFMRNRSIDRDRISIKEIFMEYCFRSDFGYYRSFLEYESYKKDKLIVRYEDLIRDPVNTIESVSEFLGLGAENFLKNFDYYKQESLKNIGNSFTMGEYGKENYHSYNLSADEKMWVIEYFNSLNINFLINYF